MARWKSVALENLFGIDGRVEHAFSHPDLRDECLDRAFLIEGAGLCGMGAPSALMLLFAGLDSPAVRTVGFPPRLLTVEQFVFGLPGTWDGMIGPRARERSSNTTARVVAEIEIDGMLVVAERFWTFEGATFEEKLRVEGVATAPGLDERTQLARILPAAAAPLFFADGGALRDMFDHPARSRLALDIVSRRSFFDTLIQAVDGSTSSAGASRTTKSSEATPDKGGLRRGMEGSLSDRRDRALRDLQATTHELERLAEALEFDVRTFPVGTVPDDLTEQHRAWLDRPKPPPLLDCDAASLHDLGHTPASRAVAGRSWAELRFIEISASARRLERELAELPSTTVGVSPVVFDDPPCPLEAVDDRSMRMRLIDCLVEFSDAVRARRASEVSDRIERYAPFAKLLADGSLSLTKPGGWAAGRAEIDTGSREIVGFALVEAFAHLSGHALPIVVDDAFGSVSRETREQVVPTFFGGHDE